MEEKAEESTEVQELELVERVFLRLGSADGDDQLERTLGRFLAPLILKLTSKYKSVQDKVLELLNHVNKRLKSRPLVQLPVEVFLSQFKDPHASPLVSNFSLVYLKMGYPRLPGSEQARLLPSLLQAVEGKTELQQDILLQLCVPSLVHVILPKSLTERRALFSLEGSTRTILLKFLLHYLLLPYGAVDVQSNSHPAPPGLSYALVVKVTGGNFLEAEQLERVKMAVLQLLSSEIFTAQEIICHLIVAAADPKHSVSDQADHHLKQFASSVDWDSPQLVTMLFSLYQGTVAVPGKRQRPQSAPPTLPKDHLSPASLRVRLRMMPFLIKSVHATNCFPACIQVVFDSLFGSVTNVKLRILTLDFIHHICNSATDQKLLVMAPVLLTGLNKITDQPDEETKLQVLAYLVIGNLGRRVPALFKKDTKHVVKLFEAIKKDVGQDVRLGIQECLSLMAGVYKGVTGQSALIVEALMLENIYSSTPQARVAAVQYATTVFPFSHAPSRYVCMIASGDSKDGVREEGRRGLKKEEREHDEPPPEFTHMLQYFHKRASLTLQSGSVYTTEAGKLPFPPPVLSEALRFLRACLIHSAGVTEEQELTNQTLAPIAKYLNKLATSDTDAHCLPDYLGLLKLCLGPAGDSELHSVAMEGLLGAVAASPPEVALSLSTDIQQIRGFTHGSKTETRESAGRLLGILAGLLEESRFLTLAEEILRDAKNNTNYNAQHGAIVSLGYVIGSCLPVGGGCHGDSAMETESSGRVDIVRQALQQLVSLVSLAPSLQLTSAACGGIGEISRCGPLPLPDSGEELSKASIVTCLSGKLKSAKDSKLKEWCALSLGHIAVGDPYFSDKQSILRALFQVRDEKAVELQFTVGEAISCATAGPLSTASHDPWRLPSNQTERYMHDANNEVALFPGFPPGTSCDSGKPGRSVVDAAIMPWALGTILDDFINSPLAIIRQSACVWLLSLLKHAGTHPDIQAFLQRIQAAFMNMLAETNDVTQEVASRGLGLVYELGDSLHREGLVGMLVGTLMEGRRSTREVTGETKVFREGSLGKSPEGSGLSTYKELCSLASDLNKPDLVYKFMHLANHHALWNSKKGAAFGFSTIATQSQEQLAPYLPTLVPRLYRYKYDPSPRIQLAMSSIWSAVIPESKKAVDKYLQEIMKDLLDNLNSSSWRNREASCMALGDLIVGRQAGEVVEHLPRFWELCLRARDDIKESVRKAADVACKALHKVTMRACDSSTMEKTGAQVVEGVLPLLLNKGMANPAAEVRSISLLSILKISENAGVLLKLYIPVLVPTLLESLSSLEPQALNTLSLRLSGETGIQEKLEDMRVAASKSSPMMETINVCVPHIDREVLAALVPRIVEILKTGIGLGTKVTTAQFVISLVHHSLQDLNPYAGKLLNALLSGLSDRSSAVRKAYAKAIGHLVKVAKDTSISKALEKLKKWYFEKDDANTKAAIAHVFHATAVHSLDTAKAVASDFLPLTFLAMHSKPTDDDPSSEECIKLWKETWEEVVVGTESGIRLYLGELVGVVIPALSAQSWHIKAQGAAALATIAEKMGSALGPPHLTTIVTSLLEALQGRTWDGKESLLKALRTVSVSCKNVLLSQDPHQPTTEKIVQALLQQCKKRSRGYRTVAIETTGEVVEALEVDSFSELCDILLPILSSEGSSNNDSDEEDKRANSEAILELQAKAFKTLGQAWPNQPQTQRSHFGGVCKVLSTALPVNTWRIQLAILSALFNVFDRLAIQMDDSESEMVSSQTIPAVCKCIGNVKYSAIRLKALQTLDKLTTYLQANGKLNDTAVASMVDSLGSVTDPQQKELAQMVLRRLTS